LQERSEYISCREFDRLRAMDWTFLREEGYHDLYAKAMREASLIIARKQGLRDRPGTADWRVFSSRQVQSVDQSYNWRALLNVRTWPGTAHPLKVEKASKPVIHARFFDHLGGSGLAG
jgi:hypothetical protein